MLGMASLIRMRRKRKDHLPVAPAVILNAGQYALTPRRPDRGLVERLRPYSVIQHAESRLHTNFFKKGRYRLRNHLPSAPIARPVLAMPEIGPDGDFRARLRR